MRITYVIMLTLASLALTARAVLGAIEADILVRADLRFGLPNRFDAGQEMGQRWYAEGRL